MPVKIRFEDPAIEAWNALKQTADSLVKCEEIALSGTGRLLQQHIVLQAIAAATKYYRGPVTLRIIANWLDRHPNSITGIIDRMDKNGLVKKLRDAKDRRIYKLELTQKGWGIFSSGFKHEDKVREAFSILSSEELELFNSLLQRVRDKTYEMRNLKDKVISIDDKTISVEVK
jgi:MarR family transcriptional regulator, 2-MHQ and catechol-resistance regulon repressor